MKLIKRIKNLWLLSQCEVPDVKEVADDSTIKHMELKNMFVPKKTSLKIAQIIKVRRKDPLDDILEGK